MLRGRDDDRAALARLAGEARAGRSGVLVVRGEAGIGKTALLDQAAREAEGLSVLRATGVEAESALPFAALQMLLRPVLDRLDALPGAQASALRGALGLSDAAGGEPFLVGLAVLSLLSEHAAERPVLCLVDDAHWLDPASAEALLFAARRFEAEGIALVIAAREDGFDAPGVPELRLGGLDRHAAAELLAERAPGLAAPVRDLIIEESAGNPLALIELPGGLSDEQRAGRAAPPAALPVTRRVLDAFGARIGRLPERSRLALVVAAAEGTGDLGTVVQAAGALGASVADLEAAERAGLLRITGVSLAFRHPLIRSAAYQSASLTTRLAVHGALADALDGDRRVLHRAAATVAPDEGIAIALERAADGARGRGALAATVPLYERAAQLSTDTGVRARRLMLAAQAAITTGRTEQADALTERAARATDDPHVHAGLAMVRATVEFERGAPRGTAQFLAESAAPIADEDPGLALTLLVIAAGNAWSTGETAALRRVAKLAAALRPAPEPIPESMAALGRLAEGDHARGLPVLRALVAKTRTEPPDSLIARIYITTIALLIGDDEAALELAASDVARSRRRGLAGALPATLLMLAQAQVMAGRHRDAAASVAEALEFARDIGQRHRIGRLNAVTVRVAAVEGDEDRCRGLTEAKDTSLAEARAYAECALGLLDLGLGRYEEALRRYEEVSRGAARHTAAVMFAGADLVEAAVRAGLPERAEEPFGRFAAWAEAAERPWASAVALRCQALLLGPAEEAGRLFTRAVRLHEEGGRPFERARTELLHGEWLRRARRRSDARAPLRSALVIFERLGAAPWAERTRAELRATGESASATDTGAEDLLARLTPQELRIVRLAAAGVSNREIAAQLFLSHRTVGYHLYKAYPKLGVGSRAELARFHLT